MAEINNILLEMAAKSAHASLKRAAVAASDMGMAAGGGGAPPVDPMAMMGGGMPPAGGAPMPGMPPGAADPMAMAGMSQGAVDPATGMPVDPMMGGAGVDPVTGQPVAPPAPAPAAGGAAGGTGKSKKIDPEVINRRLHRIELILAQMAQDKGMKMEPTDMVEPLPEELEAQDAQMLAQGGVQPGAAKTAGEWFAQDDDDYECEEYDPLAKIAGLLEEFDAKKK